ncbi:MAG: hypothetical protein K0S46_2674 [Moraxellaceae bacterium]|jgi:hypothetical protein|nr:hypothetical protein [Moraxellaceae bacterium]
MKRTSKWVLGVTLILVLGIAGGLYWTYHSLDHLVASAIRTYGSQITGVPVKVGSVRIKLGDGSATLRDLSIGNPPGFEGSHALALHEISLSIDIQSINSPVIVIRKFSVTDLDVGYEVTRNGNNFNIIKGNINRYLASSGSSKASDSKDKKDSSNQRFILRKVDITGGKVAATSSFMPDKPLTASLPEIHLRNIGKAPHGATPGEISKEIFGVIAKRSASAVAKASAGDAMRQLKDGDSGGMLKGLFN